MNVTGKSEVGVLKHVVQNPADVTTELSFVGIGESLHYHRHITSRLMIDKQQTLAVNAV